MLAAARGEDLTGASVGPTGFLRSWCEGGMGVVTARPTRARRRRAETAARALDRRPETTPPVRDRGAPRFGPQTTRTSSPSTTRRRRERHFIATELNRGRDVASRLARSTPAARRVAGHRAASRRALDAAHEAGYHARDVKPENVMIRRRGRYVKVLDFGLAKLTQERRRRPSRHQRRDAGADTGGLSSALPPTCRPSRRAGRRTDARTDGWSLWVMPTRCSPGGGPSWARRVRTSGPCFKDEPPALPAHLPPAL